MDYKFGKKNISQNTQSGKPVFLKVQYSQKDEAKALGCFWNPKVKSWYIYDNHPNFEEVSQKYNNVIEEKISITTNIKI